MMFFPGGRWIRYGQTKLANAAFTACLHEKLRASDSKIKALVAHPGSCFNRSADHHGKRWRDGTSVY